MDEGQSGYVHESLPTPPMDSEIWKLLLDRSQIPETMVHTLKGEVWTYDVDQDTGRAKNGRWVVRGDPLMNDRGVRFFSSFLYSAMSPDKLATNVTDEEVKRMARDMSVAIITLIAERGEEFGISSANRTYIVELLDHYYFTNLTASRRGTILGAIRAGYERKEVYSPAQKPQFKLPNILG